jgi:hypothetical protein
LTGGRTVCPWSPIFFTYKDRPVSHALTPCSLRNSAYISSAFKVVRPKIAPKSPKNVYIYIYIIEIKQKEGKEKKKITMRPVEAVFASL